MKRRKLQTIQPWNFRIVQKAQPYSSAQSDTDLSEIVLSLKRERQRREEEDREKGGFINTEALIEIHLRVYPSLGIVLAQRPNCSFISIV